MNRYEPKKLHSPAKAIREHCIECMGGRGTGQNYAKLIVDCVTKFCALHDFRFGKNPFNTKNLSGEEKKRRAVRLKMTVVGNKTSNKSA